jgi:hypothetical protein
MKMAAGGQIKALDGKKPLKDALAAAFVAQIGRCLFALTGAASGGKKKLSAFSREICTLKQLLLFAAPLLAADEYARHAGKIDFWLKELQLSLFLDKFAERWQQIRENAAEINITDAFAKLLAERLAQTRGNLVQSFARGSCTADIFSLWSWIESGPWRDNTEITAAVQLENYKDALLNKIALLAESGLSESVKLYEYCRSLAYGLKILPGSLPKDAAVTTKNLAKILSALEGRARTGEAGAVLFSLFKPSDSRLVYRDAGILYGSYLREFTVEEARLAGRLKDLIKDLKKPGDVLYE